MNDLIVKDNIKIESLIYEVRGKQVMLDSDLAKLFQITTGNLNKAKTRNINRFPEDFYFQLTLIECKNISRFQNGTLNKNNRKQGTNIKYLPYVFTEQGVAMLSSVLKTEIADITSINIMRAFVAMRKYISTNMIEQKYINNLVLEHDYDIKLLKESFNKLSTKEEVNHIFYEGQIYDAYSLLMDILFSAKEKVIIIDNYAGKKLFDIIKDIKVKVSIYTKNIDDIAKTKYEEQYSNIEIITTDIFHDRFILIDKKILYHCGASFKDIGSKCFAITKMEDDILINDLISRLEVIK